MVTNTVVGDLHQILPLLIVWGTASLILLGDVWFWRNRRDLNPIVAIIGTVVALGACGLEWYEGALGANYAGIMGDDSLFGRSVLVDGPGMACWIALLVASLLSILLAWTYLRTRGIDHGEYYVLLLLSVSGGMLMATANDLIVLFLGLEVLSFALYVMAGFARTEARSEEASLKYFLLGAFASAFLLYGIALVYGATATTNLKQIYHNISIAHHVPTTMLLCGVALLLVGLGFKAAAIPFHQWTPDVYEGAPTSVTALMAAVAKIGAFAAILRVFSSLVPVQAYWLPALQIIAILTMVLGNLLAVQQTNVKRMLAYSSIAHAGYLLVAVAALSHPERGGAVAHDLAWSGAVFYLFAYTFMTVGAFGVLVYLSGVGRDIQYTEDLRGLVRRSPVAAWTMMFFLLSLGGIPPTMGFMGKWQIFLAAIQANEIMLAVVLALSSVIAVYYYLRIVYMMTFEEPIEEIPATASDRGPASVSIFIAAAATLIFGIIPGWLTFITSSVR